MKSKPEQVLDSIWTDLRQAQHLASHPFHTPALATLTSTGPAIRTVVLRHADPDGRLLLCHTDLRSPKVTEIHKQPEVAWMFYDPGRKTQLRMNGTAVLHHLDELARQRWEASAPRSRVCYRSEYSPGSRLGRPAANAWENGDGFANFLVVCTTITSIDWLYLRAKGHQRARFSWLDGAWKTDWIAP